MNKIIVQLKNNFKNYLNKQFVSQEKIIFNNISK